MLLSYNVKTSEGSCKPMEFPVFQPKLIWITGTSRGQRPREPLSAVVATKQAFFGLLRLIVYVIKCVVTENVKTKLVPLETVLPRTFPGSRLFIDIKMLLILPGNVLVFVCFKTIVP